MEFSSNTSNIAMNGIDRQLQSNVLGHIWNSEIADSLGSHTSSNIHWINAHEIYACSWVSTQAFSTYRNEVNKLISYALYTVNTKSGRPIQKIQVDWWHINLPTRWWPGNCWYNFTLCRILGLHEPN